MLNLKGSVTTPKGFRVAATAAGIKKNQQLDLMLLVADTTATAAGVFTKNRCQAAPVLFSKEQLQKSGGYATAILCNSGNANCLTSDGATVSQATAAKVADALQISPEHVLVASTGVIGVPLPAQPIIEQVEDLSTQLNTADGAIAAQAIMTTDTYAKHASVTFTYNGHTASIGAIAKGSGMIHPNMGTMLSFITTDVAIAPDLLQAALLEATETSFNQISVDGDMSTNDTVFLLASGKAGWTVQDDGAVQAFQEALTTLMIHLAKSIAGDGEGAEHLIVCKVLGADTLTNARTLAKAVISSNLLKCAVHGHDANWGRILSAAGQTGIALPLDTLHLSLGTMGTEVTLFQHGTAQPFDEAFASQMLGQPVVTIQLNLGQGDANAEAYGCDLSAEYVKINADYRS